MSIATVIYLDGHRQQLVDADKDAAIEAYEALRRREPAVIETVRKVILPPSWQPLSYQSAIQEGEESKLTNPGVLQGQSEIMPRGDR